MWFERDAFRCLQVSCFVCLFIFNLQHFVCIDNVHHCRMEGLRLVAVEKLDAVPLQSDAAKLGADTVSCERKNGVNGVRQRCVLS